MSELEKTKTFEESLHEIERIVSAMERGDLALEDSIQGFEKGMQLIEECNKKLLVAEKAIKILEKNSSGQWEEKKFESHEKQDGSESTIHFNEKVKPSRSKPIKTSISAPKDSEDETSSSLELF